jgi:hypothetical protein
LSQEILARVLVTWILSLSSSFLLIAARTPPEKQSKDHSRFVPEWKLDHTAFIGENDFLVSRLGDIIIAGLRRSIPGYREGVPLSI